MSAWQAVESGLPCGQRRKAGRVVAVITEDDQYRYLHQGGDLLGAVRRAATRLDEHQTPGRGRVEQRRSRGNDPDCECPISTAPPSWPARSDSALKFGLGVGRPPRLTSGTPCFESSSTAFTGNWLSAKGAPGFDAEAEVRPDDLVAESQPGGRLAGGAVPARTLLKRAWLKPERPRPTWSGTYTGWPLRTKYSSQPIRPSGVVSHDLPVRVAPWTITTGTLPSPPCGTMYRTYIWLTVMWPPGPRPPSSTWVCSAFSPPT